MALTVTVTKDDFPKDVEFDIPGLGVFVNGKPRQLSEDDEAAFVTRNMQTVKDALKGSDDVKVEGSTSLTSGVKGVLGVDPSEISDEPSLSALEVQADNTAVDSTKSTDKK